MIRAVRSVVVIALFVCASAVLCDEKDATTSKIPSSPAEPETLSPAEPETLSPAEPETLSPAEPETLSPAEPETVSPSGRFLGSWMETRQGRRFHSYRGVRYAEPPTGKLRFQPPVPITQYKEDVDARNEGPACPQPSHTPGFVTDEDCLRLNVYTPGNDNSSKPLPVVVYIHPGGFYSVSGRSDFAGPHYLLEKDIVLVTINYRLGSLGFLSTGDKWAPGNNGFKDQVAALRWVQRNIRAFGGDPDLVTVAGYSAGSLSIGLHMISPMTKGLFHRAIMMSAAPISQVVIGNDQHHLAKRQEKILGRCHTYATQRLVACLRTLPWQDIGNSLDNMFEFGYDPVLLWSAVVEPDCGQERYLVEPPLESIQAGRIHTVPLIISQTEHEFFWKAFSEYDIILWSAVVEPDCGQERYLVEQLLESIQAGRIHTVPLIISQTEHEFFWKAFSEYAIILWSAVVEPDCGQERYLVEPLLESIQAGRIHTVPLIISQTEHEFFWKAFNVLNNKTLFSQMSSDWARIAPIAFMLPAKGAGEGASADVAAHTLKEAYFGNVTFGNDSTTAAALGKLYSDAVIGFGVHRTSRLMARHSAHPVYQYEFTYFGNNSHYKDPITKKPIAAVHHDELIYLLSIPAAFPEIPLGSGDNQIVEKLVDIWYNFARFGDPNPRSDSPSLAGLSWPAFTPDKRQYLKIDKEFAIGEKLFEDRFDVWNKLYPVQY